MRDFWQHLKAAWNYWRAFPYVEAADAQDFWNEDDARNLALFFKSHTGQKLQHRLRNYSIKMAVAAVSDPTTTVYRSGQASGVSAAVAAIDAHFPQSEPEPEGETLLEQMAAEAG